MPTVPGLLNDRATIAPSRAFRPEVLNSIELSLVYSAEEGSSHYSVAT